jgi:hypothetical protein
MCHLTIWSLSFRTCSSCESVDCRSPLAITRTLCRSYLPLVKEDDTESFIKGLFIHETLFYLVLKIYFFLKLICFLADTFLSKKRLKLTTCCRNFLFAKVVDKVSIFFPQSLKKGRSVVRNAEVRRYVKHLTKARGKHEKNVYIIDGDFQPNRLQFPKC